MVNSTQTWDRSSNIRLPPTANVRSITWPSLRMTITTRSLILPRNRARRSLSRWHRPQVLITSNISCRILRITAIRCRSLMIRQLSPVDPISTKTNSIQCQISMIGKSQAYPVRSIQNLRITQSESAAMRWWAKISPWWQHSHPVIFPRNVHRIRPLSKIIASCLPCTKPSRQSLTHMTRARRTDASVKSRSRWREVRPNQLHLSRPRHPSIWRKIRSRVCPRPITNLIGSTLCRTIAASKTRLAPEMTTWYQLSSMSRKV